MVPKLHAKGMSFKGAAAYLLHDKDRAETSERVAWVEMRNLLTDDPDTGWRVMAATAMDQDRLKTLAGIKSTGRKSNASVLHLSLAWHPSEKEGLSREEMLRSAQAAIRALQAEDRQAMIVCHSDEAHPHIHILINRVSAEDGRMLSSSKEKLNLSKWAEEYEKERGKILCEERVLNNEARKRGQFTRGSKDQARHIYEDAAANDNSPRKDAVLQEQKKKDSTVGRSARATKQRHEKQWNELQETFRQTQAAIRAQHLLDVAKAKDDVRAVFRPEFLQLLQKQEAEKARFLENENSVLGRLSNALRSIDFKALIGGTPVNPERRQTIGEFFDVLSSAGARLQNLRQSQAREKGQLEAKEKKAEDLAAHEQLKLRNAALKDTNSKFLRDREELLLKQRFESAKHRSDWKTRNEQRADAWKVSKTPQDGGQALTADPRLEKARQLAESARQRKKGMNRDGDDRDRER